MKIEIKFKIQSISDIITNSSSEVYPTNYIIKIVSEEFIHKIKRLLSNLDINIYDGCSENEIRIYVSEPDEGNYECRMVYNLLRHILNKEYGEDSYEIVLISD